MSLDGANLGDAHGRVIISTNVRDAMQQARQQVQTGIRGMSQSIGQGFQNIGNQISGIGQQITLATAPLALFQAKAISTASDFDAAMGMISARTGLVGEDLESIRQAAMTMGADTMFSAQQAADGFLQLLTAGLSAEEALVTLPEVLRGAAASGTDLGLTADLVTNVMSTFGLAAEDATRVVHQMNSAAAVSPANLQEMGEALSEAGGRIGNLNIPLEDVNAMLATLAQRGIRGSMAGTRLSAMFTQMQSDVPSVTAAWNQLGISLFNTDGSMRDMNTVISELDQRLDALPAQEQARLMQELAGSFGITALDALRNGESIETMSAQIADQASVTEIATQQMNTFKGLTISLTGSIETAMITAFTPFMNNVLKPMVEQQIKIVNGITAWMRENEGLTQTIITVMSKLITLGPILFIAGKALAAMGTAVTVAGTAMHFLMNPLLLIGKLFAMLTSPLGLAILAVSAFTLAWRTNFLGIRDTIETVLIRVRSAFRQVHDAWEGFTSRLASGRGVFDSLISVVGIYGDNILRVLGFSRAFSTAIRDRMVSGLVILQNTFNRLSSGFSFFSLGIRSTFTLLRQGADVFTALRFGFGQFISNMLAVTGVSLRTANSIEGAFVNIVNSAERAFGTASTIVRDFADGIRVIFTGDFVGGMFSGASEDSQIVDFWFDVREQTFGVLENMMSNVRRVVAVMGPLFSEVFTFLGNLIQNIDFEQVIRIGQVLLGLTSPIGVVLNLLRLFQVDVLSIFEDVAGRVTSFFAALNDGEGIGGALSALFGNSGVGEGEGAGGMFAGIQNALMSVVSFVTDTVIPGLDALRSWFVDDALPAIVNFIQTSVIPVIASFFEFLANAWAVVGPTLNMIATWFIQDMMPAIITFVTTAVIPAFQALFSFIGSAWSIIGPALGQLAVWFLQDALPAILEFISGTVMPAITTFIQILTDIWNFVAPFLSKLLDWFITTGLPLAIAFIEEIVIPAVEGFINLLAGIWDIVSPILSSLFDWFITNGLPFIQGAIETVTGIIDTFISTISTIWSVVEPGLNLLRDGFETVFGFIDTFVIQPVITLIESIVGIAQGVAESVGGVIGGIGDVIGGAVGFIQNPIGGLGNLAGGAVDAFTSILPGRDNGGEGRAGQPYLIGRPQQGREAFATNGGQIYAPADDGTFIPNFAEQMAGMIQSIMGNQGGQGGAPVINFSGTINANSYEEGREAYRGFHDEFMEAYRTDGN